MVELKKNGQTLVLFADAEALVEHVNNWLTDGFGDDYSQAFDLPVHGNEHVLGFTHRLDATTTPTVISDVDLYHNGVRVMPGELQLLGSTTQVMADGGERDVVRVSFVVQGFLNRVKGTMMREIQQGEAIVVDDLRDHAATMNNDTWPTTSHCFPMHYNPGLYGEDNPQWFPDAPDWSSTTTYGVNDLVTYWTGSPLKRPVRYQALTNNTNQRPDTNPTDWRPTAYGIVNHWDHVAGEFFLNDGVAEYYTMVPFFYLKHFVQETLAHYGLRPDGEWWRDTRYDRRAVYNNTTMDRAQRAYYFMATQTGGSVTVSGRPIGASPEPVEDFTIPFNDESTTPNQDPDGVWNNSTYRWTCPAAGSYTFLFWVPPDFGGADHIEFGLGKVGSPDTALVTGFRGPNSPIPDWGGLLGITQTFSLADVGSQYYPIAWRSNGSSYTLDNCWVQGWKNEANTVIGTATHIDPREHAPDMTVDEFFLDLQETYGLDLRVDMVTKTMWLNYADTMIQRAPIEATHRFNGGVEKDHSQRMPGMLFKWDQDTGLEIDIAEYDLQGEYDSLADLDDAAGPNMYAVLKDSRMALVSYLTTDGYVWKIAGYLLDEVQVGDDEDSRVLSPQLQPMMLDYVDSQGYAFLVPAIDEKGNSKFYPTGRNEGSLRVVDFMGMYAQEAGGPEIPFATPWGRQPADGTRIQNVDMNWSDAYSAYTLHWKRVAAAMAGGEAVRADLTVDVPFVVERHWAQRMHAGNQDYLVVRMPVKYGSDEHLRAEGCELLRLNPSAET